MAATRHHRFERRSFLDEQRADAFGTTKLVRRQAEHIDAKRFDIEGDASGGLHRVAMNQGAAPVCQRG